MTVWRRPASAWRAAPPAGIMEPMPATVLLVEDERKLRQLVRSYLERAGLAVLSTESGAEATVATSF